MTLPVYLAMTGSEFTSCCPQNYYPAWMACHFSPYSRGLSNFPPTLPQNSLLIVNDYVPQNGHDKDVITQQLMQLLSYGKIQKVLLDFQRPKSDVLTTLTKQLVNTLPCPVCVTKQYAEENDCPILVPPIDPHIPLECAFNNYGGRELWLELSYSPETVSVTGKGAVVSDGIMSCPSPEHWESSLNCHYKFAWKDETAVFYLYRTANDLISLLNASRDYNVTCGIGLYQELFPKHT